MRTAIFAGLTLVAYAIDNNVMTHSSEFVTYCLIAMILSDAFMTGIKIAKK